jgi:predicted phage terminase large subunit-like protein
MTNLQLSPSAAAAKVLARRRARESLLGFATYTNPAYVAAVHHSLIAEALEAVERGEISRLMITVPPRHGKSELASRRFPGWFIGRNPGKQIIAASYNSDLANDFGREVRNIVASPEFKALFDLTLAADSQAANRWHTNKGGMYVAAGVGTAITGRGADILLIDDPFKDRQEADSEITRQRVWDWYTSTAYTRLMPGGAVVVINTRWHDDDLSGRLLAEQETGGDKWEVLSLPAIDKGGNALWPEWYPLERLEQIRSVLPARDWNALYQQNPIPDDGDYFKADWIQDYDEVPENLRIYGASDYAVTDGGGDFTEHGVCGVDANSNVYILDWWFDQAASDVWIESQCDLIVKHQPLCWFGESGPIRRAIEPFLMRRMQAREAYCRVEWLASIADKPTRARPIQAMASMGKLYVPKKAVWRDHLVSQMLRFPAGKHDDAVDVLGMFGRGLQHMKTPRRVGDHKPKHTHAHGGGAWMG